MRRFFRSPIVAALLLGASLAPALAEIPASERAVLDALYTSTDGSNWTNNTNWGSTSTTAVCPGTTPVPGTSTATYSDWHGIVCAKFGADDHVVTINLSENNLRGNLPALAGLTQLRNVYIYGYWVAADNDFNSHLTSLPPDLANLTELRNFSVAGNGAGLVGSMPASLSSLTHLELFRVNDNGLTGSLPSLNGLSALKVFRAENNNLTGSLPNASLNGTETPNLEDYEVHNNQLTGGLPTLLGLTGLKYFSVGGNQLSGPIPPINHLANLVSYNVRWNQLTGSLPSLAGLSNLLRFRASHNNLDGDINTVGTLPSNLEIFEVGYNQLTGNPPVAPASLLLGESSLAPNNLNHVESPAWNIATTGDRDTPWWRDDTPVRSVTPVPTLGQWTLILLGLMVAGVAALRRGGRA